MKEYIVVILAIIYTLIVGILFVLINYIFNNAIEKWRLSQPLNPSIFLGILLLITFIFTITTVILVDKYKNKNSIS